MATQFNVNEYEPLMLSSQELLGAHWPYIEEKIQKSIDNSMQGEASSFDILQDALQGKNFIFVFKKDTVEGPDIKLVMVFEVVQYKDFNAMNIVLLSGESLIRFAGRYWQALCGWMYTMGIRVVEGDVPFALIKAMERVGFKQHSVKMRMSLTGK